VTMRPERKSALVKEWLLLLAGLAGITYQLITGEINLALLLVFTAMTGVPGLAHVLSLIRNSPIVLQSPSPQPESQGLESGNASLNSLGDSDVR
jgi:hypothetical protein